MILPNHFLESIAGSTGLDAEKFWQVHERAEQVTSVRINTAKVSGIDSINFNTPIEGLVPWCSSGFYLQSRPSFTTDPLFHAGAYYVQEASSMFLEQALKQCDFSSSTRVLDLCAAPGGKSTHLLSMMKGNGLLVSNEIIKNRASILVENITKWGVDNCIVTNNDPKDFQRLNSFFDVMVVDAPCSGSGMFRKDAVAVSEWSAANVHLCSQRQQRILADALPALKEGGLLVYSTCSYSREEDEDICDWLMNEQQMKSLNVVMDKNWGLVETLSDKGAVGYRFYPDKLRGEGFFIAVFQKQASLHLSTDFKYRENKITLPTKEEQQIITPYFVLHADYKYLKIGKDILAIPAHLWQSFLTIQSTMFIKKAGVELGQVAGRDFIPAHALALHQSNKNAFQQLEINQSDALNFLRRADLQLDTNIKGWCLLKYNNIDLGFVKILPNRINNYYPKEWRIINK